MVQLAPASPPILSSRNDDLNFFRRLNSKNRILASATALWEDVIGRPASTCCPVTPAVQAVHAEVRFTADTRYGLWSNFRNKD